tara:strand:- start:306 stop:605 length:300 start_codon:yes stop_codon:yes gene_type:complete
MKYYFGIDNVICETQENNYTDAKPLFDRIEKINLLFDEGNEIYYISKREFEGEKGIANTLLTHSQFEKWGCKYTQIILRNIIQGIYIDKGNLDPVPFFQ